MLVFVRNEMYYLFQNEKEILAHCLQISELALPNEQFEGGSATVTVEEWSKSSK